MPRNKEIPPLYHFGVPLSQGKTNIGRTSCFGVSAGNARCPLSKLRDLLASGSMMDSETLKNLLPSLFQAQSANTNTRRKEKQSSSQMEKRVCIDMAKLDEISCLSTDDKHRIKNILSLIKCESESQKVVSTKAKPKKKKVRSFKRVTKSYARENLAVSLGPVTSSKGWNKFRSNISKARWNQKCPDCKETPRVRRVSNSRASPNHPKSPNVAKVKLTGLNASSQEKLLQVLINLDNSDSYGDTLNGQPECARQPNRINIKNFKVKYVSPTYVVQYNGEDKAPELPRERFYSNVALESHLGQRPALSVRDDRKDRQSMHYEDSKPYIVGVGTVTEQMLRERSDSRQASPEDQTVRSERSPWQRESIPSYLKPPPPESPAPPASPPSASRATADAPSAKSSRCQRLLGLVRRVLCMSEAETPRQPKNGDKAKRKVTISDEVKVETPCVRTTKSQFFRIGHNK